MLSKAGDQIPVIELFEVVGKADKLPPEHIGGTVVNVGVVPEITFTVTVSVLSTLQEFVTFNIIVIDPVADGLIV